MLREISGQLWRKEDNKLIVETAIGDQYNVIGHSVILNNTGEIVIVKELDEYHFGQHVTALCEI